MELSSHLDLAVSVQAFGTSALPPAGPGGRQSGIGSFSNEVSLELGQCPKDMEDQLATTGGGIDLLREALEPDPAAIELGQQVNQGSKGTAQTIESPDNEDIPFPDMLQCSGQSRPMGLGATGRVSKDLITASGLQGIQLEMERLVFGRDTSIANKHDEIVSYTRLNCKKQDVHEAMVVVPYALL